MQKMKIVFSATEEQEKEIDNLLNELLNDILPNFCSQEELNNLNCMRLLQFDTKRNLFNNTLAEAAAVMVALGIIIHLLREIEFNQDRTYEEERHLFKKNTEIINHYGLFFPFDFDYFLNNNAMHRSLQHVNGSDAERFLIM